MLRRGGALDPRRLFGVTTLDVMRANCLAAEALGLDPSGVNVPVVGGHRAPDSTQVPLLSAASPPVRLPAERARALIARIQNAGSEVVKVGGGGGEKSGRWAGGAALRGFEGRLVWRRPGGQPAGTPPPCPALG